MSVDHHSGKGYAPLPQSISNTDTEDEEERLTQSNNIVSKIHDTTIIPELHINYENGSFCPLDETRNRENNTRSRQNTVKYYQDDIPVLVIEESEQDDFWKRKEMSPMRCFCLFASILLCIVTIVIFLYKLPCDGSTICPSIMEPQSSISWDRTLQGVEVNGPITIVPGSPYNLILLLRGEQSERNNTNRAIYQRQISPGGGGIMSMQGNSGLPLWLVPLKRLPAMIDCSSIDIDRSGKPDCIVAGEQGLLVSIEPVAGTIHWSSTIHTFAKLPVILPDIDADDIEDLLSVSDNTNTSSVVILSGKTGQLLRRYSTTSCTIDIYTLVSMGKISFDCYDDSGKYVRRFMTLKGLLHDSKLREVHKKLKARSEASPRLFETLKTYTKVYSWKPTPYHHLSVENEGECPGQFCRATVNLTLQKVTSEPIVIWDHVSSNVFASKPEFLVTSDKPYTFGFIIKFWQWIDTLSGNIERTVTEQRLVESVLIVTVNYTDVQAINASQSDVIQLCHEVVCQPDLNSRKQFSSIAIKYINDDAVLELISYWSSYNADSTKGLTSKIQVVKMDSVMANLVHGNV